MTSLLHIEELQAEVDVRAFDMQGVTFVRAGNMLALTIPGLAEGRPSLIVRVERRREMSGAMKSLFLKG